MPHAPATQAAVPWAGVGHIVPQAPQWLTLDERSTSQPSAAVRLQSP